MTLIPERVDTFFSTARERHSIYLRRKAGQKPPYSEDPIFQHWKFTNVFRELDKTTVWFRKNVRERLRAEPQVLLATVVFRFFNRIGTGEAIFCQFDMAEADRSTAWEKFLRDGDTDHLRRAIITYIGMNGPYVTGSYIVKTPEGFTKLDGVLKILEWFYQDLKKVEGPEKSTLQGVAEWLEDSFRFIGHFTAYEIVSDLRHTDPLCNSPDIMTWANAGPGATRGLNYLHGREKNKSPSKGQLVEEMRELLTLSRDPNNWHGARPDWPSWEMREVEHWACEFYKITRMRDHGITPRQRFRTV